MEIAGRAGVSLWASCTCGGCTWYIEETRVRDRNLGSGIICASYFSSSLSLALSSHEVGGGFRFGSLPMSSFDLMLPIPRMLSICSRVNVSSVRLLTLLMCV